LPLVTKWLIFCRGSNTPNPPNPLYQGGVRPAASFSPPLTRGGREGFGGRREGFAAVSRILLAVFLAFSLSQPLRAKEAAPLAQDEAVEKRLVEISSELRCLVCQNESLSGSHAELANDLRREIRTLIRAGKSDGEIMDFMVSRYGDFVRYRPPLKATTLLLWFGPALLLVGGVGALLLYLRRRNKAIDETPLSAEERRQAERLLKLEDEQQ
jgi:cytochrome c-type biogenesis protein CcmH